MKISIRYIGELIIEMTCKNTGGEIMSDIADRNGMVDAEFINELEDIVQELKDQNESIIKKS